MSRRTYLLIPFVMSLILGGLGLWVHVIAPDGSSKAIPPEFQNPPSLLATPPPGAQPDAWFMNTLYDVQRDEALLVLAGILLVATLLNLVSPQARRRIRLSVILYAIYMAAIPVCGVVSAGVNLDAYAWARGVVLWCQALTITNLVAVLLFDVLLRLLKAPIKPIARDLLSGAAYVVVSLWVIARAGVDLSGILTPTAIVAGVIGLSIQSTLADAVCGVFIEWEDAIDTGDWVKVGDVIGKVKEIRWRHTAIETRNWETVLIPNSLIMKSKALVLGRRTQKPIQWRRWIWFHVGYQHPPTEVISVVEQALLAAPIVGVAGDPAPNCIVMNFDDWSPHYAVRYWLTDLARDDPTDSAVRTRIHFALRRAGIEFALPKQTLHLTQDDEASRERAAASELQERLEVLKTFKLFSTLNEQELASLVPHLRPAPFTANEVITSQGNQAHWLYLLLSGEATVRITLPGGAVKTVAQLEGGDFFGEMALLTGEVRSATVQADTDCECWRLGRKGFRRLIADRPELADELSSVLAERAMELEEVASGAVGSEDLDAKRKRLTAVVSAFFGLTG